MRQFAFALILLLTSTTGALRAGEVGYDTTLGQVHADVTHGYNRIADPDYGGFPGQVSQRVAPGHEALERIDLAGFTPAEQAYLKTILSAEGSKAVILDGIDGNSTSIYVPIPSHSEPFAAVPETLQYKVGVWTHGNGPAAEECTYRDSESGDTGDAPGCRCQLHRIRCCPDDNTPACKSDSRCQQCVANYGTRPQLEDQFGPDPRWTRLRPFAELLPGQRLEVEATLPD